MTRENGLVKVPYRPGRDEPLDIMRRGRDALLSEVEGEDLLTDPDWAYLLPIDYSTLMLLLSCVSVRILRTESTVTPSYREAVLEVTGRWVDGEGEPHDFYGVDDTKEAP